ncbi:MAG: threonine synthase [Candidatus Bathyarchaeia archaeon]
MIKLNYVKAIKCRECGKELPPVIAYTCDECFGPLDVLYDYDSIELRRNSFKRRPRTVWRYSELLPVSDVSKAIDIGAGYTALRKCVRLGECLGLKNLYVKDDTVNPTGSFKDRPAAVAVSTALQFGMKAVGCASTGNLAASVAAHAAIASLKCYVFVPTGIEMNKIVQATTYGATIISVKGTYDDANRLAAQAGDAYGLALANINIRPYYVEGSKTLAFETCEQLGWKTPDLAVIPVGSGALLCAIQKGFEELNKLGLINSSGPRLVGVQPEGCSPVVNAFRTGAEDVHPVEEPRTVAKSLAIGDPGDGVYALKLIRKTGGVAESVTDEEILQGIRLLAKTEGVFSEPAGGVSIAVLRKLLEYGKISRDEVIVCYVTGNGLKAGDALLNGAQKPIEVEPTLSSLAKVLHLRRYNEC